MNPPKMPIHIGDYHRDTGHLRAAEHGAYLMLLFHYWATGGLPDDDRQLSAIARMSPLEWKKARPVIVPFFKPGWKHGRVDFDLDKAAKISEGAREAGLASGRTRSQRNTNDRSTIVEPTLEPLNHSKKEDTADAVTTVEVPYAFESGIIRLNQKHFDQWRQNFTHLDVGAELIALTPWAEQQGPARWFHAVASALAKRNRAVKAAKDKGETAPPFKWNGIEGVL